MSEKETRVFTTNQIDETLLSDFIEAIKSSFLFDKIGFDRLILTAYFDQALNRIESDIGINEEAS